MNRALKQFPRVFLDRYETFPFPSKIELYNASAAKKFTTKIWNISYYIIAALTIARIIQFLDKKIKTLKKHILLTFN
jgi:hypothetical protein